MLNCVFDCRYCFLQGMYQSAHMVHFVNHESFKEGIINTCTEHTGEDVYFFSGYDCDSLAMNPITGFLEDFLPFFAENPRAILELRSKSVYIRQLLKHEAFPNCVVAFTLSPDSIQKQFEAKTPSLDKRLEAIEKLQKHGWKIGLRFDPLIFCQNYENIYRDFFENVFSRVDLNSVHSMTMGTFRLPKGNFAKMKQLYPDEKLFAGPLEKKGSTVSYEENLEKSLLSFCHNEIAQYTSTEKLFMYPELNS